MCVWARAGGRACVCVCVCGFLSNAGVRGFFFVYISVTSVFAVFLLTYRNFSNYIIM
jgi:hypothetical protein